MKDTTQLTAIFCFLSTNLEYCDKLKLNDKINVKLNCWMVPHSSEHCNFEEIVLLRRIKSEYFCK